MIGTVCFMDLGSDLFDKIPMHHDIYHTDRLTGGLIYYGQLLDAFKLLGEDYRQARLEELEPKPDIFIIWRVEW